MTETPDQRVERLLGAYSESQASEFETMRANNLKLSRSERADQLLALLVDSMPLEESALKGLRKPGAGPDVMLLQLAVDLLKSFALSEDGIARVSDAEYSEFVDAFLTVAPTRQGLEDQGLLAAAHVVHLYAYLFTEDYGTRFFEGIEQVRERTRAQLKAL